MKGAKIENKSYLPPEVVEHWVGWVLDELDVNSPDVLVRVKNTLQLKEPQYPGEVSIHCGACYQDPSWAHPFRFLISARIPKPFIPYQHDRKMRGGPPPIDPVTPEEALVCIVAHEATHIRQALTPSTGNGYVRHVKGKYIHVRAQQYSEVDAEWAEYRLLKRYRERREL